MNLFFSFLLVALCLTRAPLILARTVERKLQTASPGELFVKDQYIVQLIGTPNSTTAAMALVRGFSNAMIGTVYDQVLPGFVVTGSKAMINALEKSPIVKSIKPVSQRLPMTAMIS